MNPLPVLAAAGALLLASLLVRTPPVEMGATALVPLLAVTLLEGTAPRLPGFGFFSAAFAGYLGVALVSDGGERLAAFLLLAGVGLRTLVRGRPGWRLAEALADLVPAAAGLAAMRLGEAMLPLRPLLPPLDRGFMAVGAGLVAWLVLVALVPLWLAQRLGEEDRMEWEAVRDRLFPLYVGVAFGGVILPSMTLAGGWTGLLALPLLFALHQGASVALFRAGLERGHILESRVENAEREMVGLRQELRDARVDLRRNVEEHVLLDTFASTLLATRSLDRVVDATLDTARSVLPCRSTALFLFRDGELVPAGWRSPLEELLASMPLVRASEPVVVRAWEDREPCLARPRELASARIFEGERSAMAVPVADLGVLYMGYEAPDAYGSDQLRLLSLVAGQASLALEVSARQEAEQEALRLHEEAHHRLDGWVGAMDHLLDGLRELIAELEPAVLRERLERLLPALVPCDLQVVAFEGDGLVEAVMANRRPLLLDDVEGTRFDPPAPGIRSVLAVPMLVEGGPVGAIVLGSARPGAFERQHQDLIFLLGYLAGAAFLSADTHRKLKESQAALVQSSKMASVGQLAAGVAHELNTPLGAVVLRLDGALRSSDPAKVQERVRKAREAVGKAQAIVAKLLFYSRDAAGERREVRLDEVVRDTLELMGLQLRLDGVALEEDLHPVEPVLGDQNELQQVASNLLLNARDAGGWVRVSTFMDGGESVLRVEDGGSGMTPEVKARIFDPFFTTKEVGRGTGLGLSVSMEIVRAHGGRLEVESEPGRGSVFTVRLQALGEEGRDRLAGGDEGVGQ